MKIKVIIFYKLGQILMCLLEGAFEDVRPTRPLKHPSLPLQHNTYTLPFPLEICCVMSTSTDDNLSSLVHLYTNTNAFSWE